MGGDNGYGDPEPQFFTWDSYTGITRALKNTAAWATLSNARAVWGFFKAPQVIPLRCKGGEPL